MTQFRVEIKKKKVVIQYEIKDKWYNYYSYEFENMSAEV